MTTLWQLKKLSTDEALNEPQPLPENWGSIFGMSGIKDRLGDLSWLGDAFADQGWFEILEPTPPEPTKEDRAAAILAQIDGWLKETDPIVTMDNISIVKGSMAEWLEYRRLLREIHLQPGFPDEIYWPNRPE